MAMAMLPGSELLRAAVSRKKHRIQEGGFDLDATYVTPRVIAFAFPADRLEAAYRNPWEEVYRFLEKYHHDRYKVWNLCSERSYPASRFHGRVLRIPFPDHCPPSLQQMGQFVTEVEQHLSSNPLAVAVVHCKAGKGRTGCMISAWMLAARLFYYPDDSLAFYGFVRTSNGKGVTIPSQARYVSYFANLLLYGKRAVRPRQLKRLSLNTGASHHCDYPDLRYSLAVQDAAGGVLHKVNFAPSAPGVAALVFEPPVTVCGSFKVTLKFRKQERTAKEKFLHFWLHTAFLDEHIELLRENLDRVNKDPAYPAELRVSLKSCLAVQVGEPTYVGRELEDFRMNHTVAPYAPGLLYRRDLEVVQNHVLFDLALVKKKVQLALAYFEKGEESERYKDAIRAVHKQLEVVPATPVELLQIIGSAEKAKRVSQLANQYEASPVQSRAARAASLPESKESVQAEGNMVLSIVSRIATIVQLVADPAILPQDAIKLWKIMSDIRLSLDRRMEGVLVGSVRVSMRREREDLAAISHAVLVVDYLVHCKNALGYSTVDSICKTSLIVADVLAELGKAHFVYPVAPQEREMREELERAQSASAKCSILVKLVRSRLAWIIQLLRSWKAAWIEGASPATPLAEASAFNASEMDRIRFGALQRSLRILQYGQL